MLNEAELRVQAKDFLNMVFLELDNQNFKIENHWHIDHLCLRTSTEQSYQSFKNQFQQFSELLIESEVNGRMISTFKLRQPIIYNDWSIDLIEIPAPKTGKVVKEGFEHFEIVCDLDFTEIKSNYKNFLLDDSGLKKDFNQEFEIQFKNFAIKFHHYSLESVINLEKNIKVFSTLKQLNILKILKEFNPLVAGTFPLCLNTNSSDIDLLIFACDFNLVKDVLIKNYSQYQEFQLQEVSINDEDSIVCNFIFNNIAFEVFGQKISPVKQDAFRHFLIEERLLKLGGVKFFEKVLNSRQKGLKTEAAFAEVLEIKENPFEALLSLQKENNKNLKNLINLRLQ